MDPEKQKRTERRARIFEFLRALEAKTQGLVVDWREVTEITVCVGLGPTKSNPDPDLKREKSRYKADNFSSRLGGRRVLIFKTLMPREKVLIGAAMNEMAEELKINIRSLLELSNPNMLVYKVRP